MTDSLTVHRLGSDKGYLDRPVCEDCGCTMRLVGEFACPNCEPEEFPNTANLEKLKDSTERI